MSNWKRGEIDPADMLPVADIVELTMSLTRLAAAAVVSSIAVSPAEQCIWRP